MPYPYSPSIVVKLMKADSLYCAALGYIRSLPRDEATQKLVLLATLATGVAYPCSADDLYCELTQG